MYYVCKQEDEGGQRGKAREENVSAFRTTKCFKISKTSFLSPFSFSFASVLSKFSTSNLIKGLSSGAKVVTLT